MICQLGGSRIGASGKNLGQAHRYLGDIGDHQQHHYTRCDHGHNCPGYLLQADFQSLFDLNTDGDKQIDTHRRRYLPDRQVDGCQNTEGHQVISQRLADRQHNGNKYVHGGVGINKASRDQEDHIHDQKENELIAWEIPNFVQTKENRDAHATMSMIPPVVLAESTKISIKSLNLTSL